MTAREIALAEAILSHIADVDRGATDPMTALYAIRALLPAKAAGRG